MTDAAGTAQATLTVEADGLGTLAYHYIHMPTSDWFNVLDGGEIHVDLQSPANVLSFTFVSPNIGTQGPYCWAGDFQGSFTSGESGKDTLSGTYELRGWSEDCFSPPRKGTFSLLRDVGADRQ